MLVIAGPSVASAQQAEPAAPASRAMFGVSVEGFLAALADPYNDALFGVGGGAALDAELNVHPLVGLQVGGSALALGRDQSSASTSWYAARAGVRLHWGVLAGLTSADGWLDAHASYGQSGAVARGGFDVGLGCAFTVVRGFRVGPFVRLGWGSDPNSENPVLLEGGLTIGLLGDPRSDDGGESAPGGEHDQDGDGVRDGEDECPVVPAGARPDAARPGCPLLDSDGDGVADRADECPTAPAGARPDPRRAGCPDGDRDADTVWDSIDACPDQPGAPSRDAARNGCPGLVRVSRESIQILQPVFFATARDIILESSYPVLAAVADAMQASGIAHIRVEGHTDSSGDDATNLELSRRRAESVRRWLIEHGIDESGVTAAGMGETVPFESNDTELGRAANRRVEFHIEQGASR